MVLTEILTCTHSFIIAHIWIPVCRWFGEANEQFARYFFQLVCWFVAWYSTVNPCCFSPRFEILIFRSTTLARWWQWWCVCVCVRVCFRTCMRTCRSLTLLPHTYKHTDACVRETVASGTHVCAFICVCYSYLYSYFFRGNFISVMVFFLFYGFMITAYFFFFPSNWSRSREGESEWEM